MERKTKERRKEKEKGRGEKEGIENHLAEMRFLSDHPPTPSPYRAKPTDLKWGTTQK